MIQPYALLLRQDAAILAFGCAFTFLSGPGQTFFVSLFIGEIALELGLSAAELGSIYLLATLGAAALLPLTGPWIDRIDLRVYALIVMGALAASCVVVSMAQGAASLLLGFLLIRLTGQGLMSHVGITSIARHFERERGRALSLIIMGFPLSEAVLPTIAVSLIALFGWQMAYALTGLGVLLLAFPLVVGLIGRRPAFYMPPGQTDDVGAKRPTVVDGFRTLARTRFFWLALPAIAYSPLVATALLFHIQIIGVAKGWSAPLLAGSFASYALLHGLSVLAAGQLVDRLGAVRILPAMLLPMMIGIGLIGASDTVFVLVLFMGLMGASAGLAHTAISATWAEVYGVRQLGTIRSFSVMLIVSSTALGPAALGVLIDAGLSIAAICAILVGVGAGASLMAVLAGQRLPARTN